MPEEGLQKLSFRKQLGFSEEEAREVKEVKFLQLFGSPRERTSGKLSAWYYHNGCTVCRRCKLCYFHTAPAEGSAQGGKATGENSKFM